MVKIGQKVEFNPFLGINIRGLADCNDLQTGMVHFVHRTHRWFNVEYTDNDGYTRLLGFKFDDIGKNVRVIEE